MRLPQQKQNKPQGAPWHFLNEYGEDMSRWGGKPTAALQARVCQLEGKTNGKENFSRRMAAPVYSEWCSGQRRQASDPAVSRGNVKCDLHKSI